MTPTTEQTKSPTTTSTAAQSQVDPEIKKHLDNISTQSAQDTRSPEDKIEVLKSCFTFLDHMPFAMKREVLKSLNIKFQDFCDVMKKLEEKALADDEVALSLAKAETDSKRRMTVSEKATDLYGEFIKKLLEAEVSDDIVLKYVQKRDQERVEKEKAADKSSDAETLSQSAIISAIRDIKKTLSKQRAAKK